MDTVKAWNAHGGVAGGLVRFGLVGAIALLALFGSACTSAGDVTATTIVAESIAPPATEATPAPETPETERFTYQIGMQADILRPNFWAYYGPDGTIVMSFVFGPTKPALFRIAYPGLVVAPDVAAGKPAKAVQVGELWTVTQPIRNDYTWSDGSLLTADDVVFTFETARDAQLTAQWTEAYPYTEGSSPRLLDVEAVDDFTVKYTFDAKPGAATWPHRVGIAPIMPKAPWERVVAAAMLTEDPAAALYDSDAVEVGDLSGGPMIYSGRIEGESIESIRNDYYANEGYTHRFWADGSYALNGEVLYGEGVGDPVIEYSEGPYVDRTVFSIYDDERVGVLALTNGNIDYWMDSAGLSPTSRRKALEADNLAVTANPSNSFLYLGFNLRKSPGKFLGFRQAMAYFDKENLTSTVLQGTVSPLYVMVPEGNRAWYNSELASEIASRYRGLSTKERLGAAYAALEADGFTWVIPAVFDNEGNLVNRGEGLIDPEGNPVPGVEILSLPADVRPHPYATNLRLEDWAQSLGLPVEANPTDLNTIFDAVWPGVGEQPTFDMVILAWALGNPAWPTFYESFFHTRNLAETTDGGNATGYSNPEFDALADAMFTETDQAAAFAQVWQMEQMIAEDLPYVVLFSAPITEFYSKDLKYPFTQTLAGIQNLAGMQGAVSK